MWHRLTGRRFLSQVVFFGLACGLQSRDPSSFDEISSPAWPPNGSCPVYYDGDTLLVRYSLEQSRPGMKVVMSLKCMTMEDDHPPSRSLVLGDDALTVASVENNVPTSAGTVPFTLPSVPQMQNVSESGPVCAITLKGERVWDREPVSIQSEPFQLRTSGGDGSQRQKTFASEGVFEGVMPPSRGRPVNITSNGSHGSTPTTPAHSVTTATIFSTTRFHAVDPTTSASPLQPTSGTDKRASEGLSKAAVAGIGVGAAIGVLLVGLMLFFPLRRRFLMWRWGRMSTISREIHREGAEPGQAKMGEMHGNPVSEVHGNTRPTAELPPGSPAVERAELRQEERREMTEERAGQQAEGRAEGRVEDTTEERTDEIARGIESVVEGRAELP
ncbi:hypothetical protein B0T09DRAFT_362598 [Sordaria sp. MPI-SDFR-AT-0083]|nr:hypothetical protein B0T09DRAFT_362598 [Sordaria sp. MPI-SDFR-AT-0083]